MLRSGASLIFSKLRDAPLPRTLQDFSKPSRKFPGFEHTHLGARQGIADALSCCRSPSQAGVYSPLNVRGMKRAAKIKEVILTKDLKKVGSAGDIVKVTKGYARNHLLPKLFALPKLDKYVAYVRQQLETVQGKQPVQEEVKEEEQDSKTEEQKLKEINAVLTRLESQRVVIYRNAGRTKSENILQENVSKMNIVDEVRRQLKVQIEEVNVDMESNISSLGDHEIPIRLPSHVEVPGGKAKLLLKVRVRRN